MDQNASGVLWRATKVGLGAATLVMGLAVLFGPLIHMETAASLALAVFTGGAVGSAAAHHQRSQAKPR